MSATTKNGNPCRRRLRGERLGGRRRKAARGRLRDGHQAACAGRGPPAADELTDGEGASAGDVAEAVESDAALAIAVMRAANNGDGPPARVGGVQEAVDALSPQRRAGDRRARSRPTTPSTTTDRSRPPTSGSAGTRSPRATPPTAWPTPLGSGSADELAIAALLHDVGRLVLVELYGDEYGADPAAENPEERIRRERRELGHRPRPRRRRAGPPLGAQARDRRGDRAPSLAGGRRATPRRSAWRTPSSTTPPATASRSTA